jgi:hypothetical protein
MQHEDWLRLAYSTLQHDADIEREVTRTSVRKLLHDGCPPEALAEVQDAMLSPHHGADLAWRYGFYSSVPEPVT